MKSISIGVPSEGFYCKVQSSASDNDIEDFERALIMVQSFLASLKSFRESVRTVNQTRA